MFFPSAADMAVTAPGEPIVARAAVGQTVRFPRYPAEIGKCVRARMAEHREMYEAEARLMRPVSLLDLVNERVEINSRRVSPHVELSMFWRYFNVLADTTDDEQEFRLPAVHRKITRYCLSSMLANMYGEDYARNATRLLKQFKMDAFSSYVFVEMTRRYGKSETVGGFTAIIAWVRYRMRIAVFSTGQRAATEMGKIIVKKLVRLARLTKETVMIHHNSGDLIKITNRHGVEVEIRVLPSGSNVSFSSFYFNLCKMKDGGDVVKWLFFEASVLAAAIAVILRVLPYALTAARRCLADSWQDKWRVLWLYTNINLTICVALAFGLATGSMYSYTACESDALATTLLRTAYSYTGAVETYIFHTKNIHDLQPICLR